MCTTISMKRGRVGREIVDLTCFYLAEEFGGGKCLSSLLERTVKNYTYDHPDFEGFKPVFFSRMPEYESVMSLLNFLDKKQLPIFILYLKQVIEMRKKSGGDDEREEEVVVVSEKLLVLLQEIVNGSKIWERRRE